MKGRKNKMINIQVLIEDEIKTRVAAREVFTAHDIKMSIREKGHWIEHKDTQQVVQSYYFMNAMGVDYTRSLIEVGASIPPFAYHPYDIDPNSHPAVKGNKAVAITKTIVAPIAANVASDSELIKTVTTKNRLMFPASVLRDAGISAGDYVFVGYFSDDNKLSVSRTYPQGANKSKGLLVDQYCNLLVGLNSFGMDDVTYKIDVETDTVIAQPI